MTYEEFVASIQLYMDNMHGMRLAFTIVFTVSLLVFFIWFGFYLRREYHRKRNTVDTFDVKIDPNLKYPGFHQGVFRDDDSTTFENDESLPEDKNKEEKKKPLFSGKINDEY